MSKYLNHTERIGSYLEGSMSPDEMMAFENQLHTDPLLKSEFELQQDIVGSLKDFRKSQLKARLDRVPVSMGPTALVGVKAAAVIVLSGIIGLGTYLYFNNTNDGNMLTVQEELVEEAAVEEIFSNPEIFTEPATETLESEVPEVVESAAEPQKVASRASSDHHEIADVAKKSETPKETPKKEEITQPVVNSPQVMDPQMEEGISEEDLEIPSPALAQKELVNNPMVEIETGKKEEGLFHYQYYSGKLYLYGDFRENPYEILELNSANGKRLYMFYNDKYYQILDNQMDITPLEVLLDHEIIGKLDIIKANK